MGPNDRHQPDPVTSPTLNSEEAKKYAASGSTAGHLSYQIGQRLGSSMAE
jgi:hypothetical protein